MVTQLKISIRVMLTAEPQREYHLTHFIMGTLRLKKIKMCVQSLDEEAKKLLLFFCLYMCAYVHM